MAGEKNIFADSCRVRDFVSAIFHKSFVLSNFVMLWNIFIQTILVGMGATFTMDIWLLLLKFFKIKSLDYRLLGRWVSNISKGKFFHNNIIKTPPVQNELAIGWIAHYLIGISFAFLLIILYGREWLDKPTLYPAIVTGIVTIVAPFFIMQPAFGFGIASSKLPKPNVARLKSFFTHTIYGIGLYLSALLFKQVLSFS